MARPCGRFIRIRLAIPLLLIVGSLVFYYVHNFLKKGDSGVSDVSRNVATFVGGGEKHKVKEEVVPVDDLLQLKGKEEDALVRQEKVQPQSKQQVKGDQIGQNMRKADHGISKEKQKSLKTGNLDSKPLSGKIAGIAGKKQQTKSRPKSGGRAQGVKPNAGVKTQVDIKPQGGMKPNIDAKPKGKLPDAKKPLKVKSPPRKVLQDQKTNQEQKLAQKAANYIATSQKKDPELLCKMPELKPFDDSIRHLLEVPERLQCNGSVLTHFKGTRFVIDKTVARGTRYNACFYSYLERYDDDITRITDPKKVHIVKQGAQSQLDFKVKSDFTIVGCQKGSRQVEVDAIDVHDPTMHVDLHAHIVERRDVIDNSFKRLRQKGGDSLGLNVILLGIESTSRMNFLRQMPKSYKLLYKMGAVTLSGYNIVGDSTTGALIPLLTGRHEAELPDVRREVHNGQYLDAYNFIWDKFALNGYVTMLAADQPKISAFNLRLNGFEHQPTDHYMRTFWQEAEVKGLCLGPKPVHQVMLDYTAEFMKSYRKLPKFGVTFFTGLTHSNINKLNLMDDDLFTFLESQQKAGAFNNTMFILFSDHGARYNAMRATMQGKLEERLPYLSILLPKWLKDRQPLFYTNLMKNHNRLTTPFDIYETMRSVVDHKPHQLTSKQKGISLFNEIPKGRTCKDASVDLHWCSCLQWQPVKFNNLTGLAKTFIGSINTLTKSYRKLCTDLSLLRIVKAERLVPTDELMRFLGTKDKDQREPEFHDDHTVDVHSIPLYFQMTVEAMPGRAVFEGTMKVHPGLSDNFVMYELAGPISRINKYGFTAACIEKINPSIAKYCFCKQYVGMPVAFMGASEKVDKEVSHSVRHALYPDKGHRTSQNLALIL